VAARRDDQHGQASVELVAVVPFLICLLLAAGQAAVAGYALWSAGHAARSGARAALVGGDPEAAARSALPRWLEEEARIDVSGPVHVSVGAPALLPGAGEIRVDAEADLDPAADG
jgi:hypothetical protein